MAIGGDRPILIKKVKKVVGGGHHGGAWKVAYADFVTAMMAFFLLMWLINTTSPEQKRGIADYFAPASVSETTSGSGGILGGTALGEDQMEVLWRLHPEPTISFDGDAAGRRAANSAIDRALPLIKPGKSFRFAIVVGGKDPDDVLREQGPAALKSQLTDTTPFVEQLFHRERDLEPLDTPERRAGLKVRLRKLAATIADPDLAQAYREDLLGRYEQTVPGGGQRFEVGAAARVMARQRWDGKRGKFGGGPIGPNAETTEHVRRMRSQ
eukprot:gene19629-19525_t